MSLSHRAGEGHRAHALGGGGARVDRKPHAKPRGQPTEDGYEHFHVYLMDAQKGTKIGPLEEIKDTLDTGADAFNARWSADSRQVAISYRVDRHAMMTIRYRIENRRAYRIGGPKLCLPTEPGCHF